MSDDPWYELSPPGSKSAISARRVDASHPWNLFWAMDRDRRCLLVLQHSSPDSPRQPLPKLRGLELRGELLPDRQPMLVLRLLDAGLRDVFLQLCLDIVAATRPCQVEAEAVDAAVARAWRWHHLLRGGGKGVLRPEAQKGLIAELLILEHYVLPSLGAAAAVAAWNGPLGAAKDFVHGSVAIESKARGTADADAVPVSSELQLHDEGLTHLYLHLCVLDPAVPGDDGAFTLSDVVARVGVSVAESGLAAAGRYEALLAAAGFRFEDDYSGYAWSGGERSIFQVAGAFPRITPGGIPAGVSDVKYMLSLSEAGAHVVAPHDLLSVLAGSA